MSLFDKTPIIEYADRLIALKGKENQVFQLALSNKVIKDFIIFLNTETQLKQEHVDSLGQELFNTLTGRSVYAQSDPLGRGGQPYEVRRSGDYYLTFNVKVGQGSIMIESNPFKANNTINLFDVYNENIEGLTEESIQKLILKAHEFFIKWYIQNILPR